MRDLMAIDAAGPENSVTPRTFAGSDSHAKKPAYSEFLLLPANNASSQMLCHPWRKAIIAQKRDKMNIPRLGRKIG